MKPLFVTFSLAVTCISTLPTPFSWNRSFLKHSLQCFDKGHFWRNRKTVTHGYYTKIHLFIDTLQTLYNKMEWLLCWLVSSPLVVDPGHEISLINSWFDLDIQHEFLPCLPISTEARKRLDQVLLFFRILLSFWSCSSQRTLRGSFIAPGSRQNTDRKQS